MLACLCAAVCVGWCVGACAVVSIGVRLCALVCGCVWVCVGVWCVCVGMCECVGVCECVCCVRVGAAGSERGGSLLRVLRVVSVALVLSRWSWCGGHESLH